MGLTVSIVIVSFQRPEVLRRCLIAISQLDYDPYEIVIVADPVTCTGLRSVPQAAFAKIHPIDSANMAEARNLGVNISAGDILAFIEDDAVPEPTWLKFLTAPFTHADTAAAGGYVRAKDGISWLFQAASVDITGTTAPIGLDKGLATILIPTQNRAIRTHSSNMAVRRSVLVALGGFDTRFPTHLFDIDLNLRLAAKGLCTALVPMAEVHHQRSATMYRRADGAPTDLTELGASWAVFLDKYCHTDHQKSIWARIQRRERARACAFMVAGLLEPRDVGKLLQQMRQGYADGQNRKAVAPERTLEPTHAFQSNPPRHDFRSVVLSGRIWSRSRLRRSARQEAASGSIVTLILLSPTALFHRVRFTADGYWQQSGGLFGKSDRSQRLVSLRSFRRRVQAEQDRVGKIRGLR